MDKYEYKIRIEEIENLIQENRYTEAAEIADTVDWKNIKEIITLCEISDVYKACRRYEDSRDVLLLAYERNPSGRMILYSLCELSIKLGDIVNAIEYYKEFQQISPRDPGRYVLKYKLFTTQEVGIDERIGVLEELQKAECREKWMYELAYLYHMAGYGEKCVEECNQIIIFFGEGRYVIKALELKVQHEPLSEEQSALYQRLTAPEDTRLVKDVDVSNYSTMDLQKEIADGLKEVLSTKEEPAVVYETETIFEPVEEEVAPAPESVSEPASVPEPEPVPEPVPVPVVEPEPIPEPVAPVEQASPVILNEVKDPIRETVSTSDIHEISVAGVTPEPIPEPDPEPVILSEQSESKDPIRETESPSPDAGETRIFTIGDIIEIAKRTPPMPKPAPAPAPAPQESNPNVIYPKKSPVNFDSVKVNTESSIRYPSFDDMVSLEGDGQMSLVVPEQAMIDKQITGQISIEDVLREWEQVKSAGERKWEEDVRRRVTDQTAELFRDFDAETRSEFLKSIEASAEPEEPLVLEDDTEIIFEDDEPAPEPVAETPAVSGIKEIELEPEITSHLPEPAADDNTTVMPAPVELDDYLEQFAAASEEKDREDAARMEALAAAEEPEIAEPETAEPEAAEPVVIEAAEIVDELIETEKTEKAEESAEEPVEESAEEPEDLTETDDTSSTPEEPAPADSDGLTDEQRERYESFIQKESGLIQLKEVLAGMSMESNKGNIVIYSDDSDSSVELARALIMELAAKHNISEGKAAKIKASTLNAKDAGSVLATLYDCAIVIQDANELRPETVSSIYRVLNVPDRKMFVAMTVNKRSKHKFISEYGKLLEAFNLSFDIEALDNSELAEFAKKYAYAKDYSIDEMGLLALHTRIEERQTNSHSVMIDEVKEIVDTAIMHASKKNVGHLFSVLTGKRYDSNDMIVLKEKDFA